MKKLWIMLMLPMLTLGVGCKGGSIFGCSRDQSSLDLKLGEPGKTIIENNLPENDNVVVLNDDENIEFLTEDGEALITHDPSKEIIEGHIIVANSDQQYLTRVKEVLQSDGGSTRVLLRQGRLQDLVGNQTGSLNIESTPVYDLSDIKDIELKAKRYNGLKDVHYETDEKGTVIIRNLELFDFDLNSQGRISAGGNRILGIPVKNPYEKLSISSAVSGKYRAVVNEARIEVVPTIRSHAEWSWGKIKDMQTRLDTRVKYRMDITYETAGGIQIEGLLDYLMPKKVIPFRIPGTPPVYLDIELGVPVGISVKSQSKGKTRIVFESEYDFFTTLHYDESRGTWVESDKKVAIRDTMASTKDSSTDISAEIYLKPQVTTRLYRVVGPYAFVKLFGRGELKWPKTHKKNDLYIGVKGGVGLELSEPIFLTSVVGFEIDDLFNFEQGFDLNNKGTLPQEPFHLKSNVNDVVTIDRVGKEGFVRLNLKNDSSNSLLRYQLLESTRSGLLVPSDGFYLDGELYFYPLPNSQDETFKVRIFGSDGSHIDKEIAINVAANVREIVSQERYGVTTNSYKVASGTPGDFASQVPGYNLGGVTVGIHEFNEGLKSKCFESSPRMSAGEMRDIWGMNSECNELLDSVNDYVNLISEILIDVVGVGKPVPKELIMFSSPEDIYNDFFRNNFASGYSSGSDVVLKKELTELKVNSKNNTFEYYNKLFLEQFAALQSRDKCNSHFQIEKIEDELFIGFKIISENCPFGLKNLPISVKNLSALIFNESRIEWNQNHTKTNDLEIWEFTVAKPLLIDFKQSASASFVLEFPIDPNVKSIILSDLTSFDSELRRESSTAQNPTITLMFNISLISKETGEPDVHLQSVGSKSKYSHVLHRLII